MGRRVERARCCAAGAVIAALFITAAMPGRDALAYSAAGDRLFPATLVLPQIAPGDEFYIWANTQPLIPGGIGTGSRQSNFTEVYDKAITERLGIVVEETWTRLDRVAKGAWATPPTP